MEISNQLLCLFSAKVEQRNDNYVVTIPDQEIDFGAVQEGATYRVALLPKSEISERRETDDQTERHPSEPEPPVEEGELKEVEIEDIGEQGDGIARVERGYVVIVPDTEKGERVTIEITDVQQNVAFAEVVERQSHFN